MKSKLVFCLLILLSTTLFSQEYKVKFFIETGVKDSGGGDYLNFTGKTGFSLNKTKWTTSGSAGLTFVLTDSLNLNLSARIQDTIENEAKDKDEWSVSYVTEKTHNLEINPMLSISYIFGRIPKTQ